MLQDIAREFKELERYDFRVLQAVETGMRFFDWVPVDDLPNYARLPRDEVEYRMSTELHGFPNTSSLSGKRAITSATS